MMAQTRGLHVTMYELQKRMATLQQKNEELQKKAENCQIAVKDMEEKIKNLQASSLITALVECDGIEINNCLTLKCTQEETAIKLWKHPIQSEKKIGLHFNGILLVGVMNLEAKRENLKGRITCGMNGHKNSLGLLIDTSNSNKGKINLFNEGTKLYSKEDFGFKAKDKIWIKIDLSGENKTVTFSYEAESAKVLELKSVTLNANYTKVYPFVAFFSKGSTAELIY